jgi:cytochrome c556
MSIRTWIITAGAVLAGSFVVAKPIADSQWKAILPDANFEALVTAEAKTLTSNLDKGLNKQTTARSRTSAMMIAGYAQSSMMAGDGKSGQMATLRDHALKTCEAIEKSKLDDAKRLAAGLSPSVKADAGAKTEPVDLCKQLELEELMHQFKPERAGGKELEKKIKAYMQKRAPLTTEEMKDATTAAYQTAIIAQFAVGYAPKTDTGKKKKADWLDWSHEMNDLAVAAAKTASAAKPDEKAVKAAMRKLDDVCTKCHAVFKEQ